MAPDSISAVALSRLILDHLLRAVRGVKRWRYQSPSMVCALPSIQPYASAASTHSA